MSDDSTYMTMTVEFWTKAGGCNRHDSFPVSSTQEIKDLIFDDLKENPYINFWYGQYIDIENLSTGKTIQIFTHDENSPIKTKLTINGKTYYGDIFDDDENDIFEIVTNGLFEGGEVILANKELTEAKLLFINDDPDNNYEFYLDYKIDYNFLNDL